MNLISAQEITLPLVYRSSMFESCGRDVEFRKELFKVNVDYY